MRTLIRAALVPVAMATSFAACTSFSIVQPGTSGTGGSGGTGDTGSTASSGGVESACKMPPGDQEPNDTAETASCLAFDQKVTGLLDPTPKDVDYYSFQGTKGDAIIIAATSPGEFKRARLTLLDATKDPVANAPVDLKFADFHDPRNFEIFWSAASDFDNYPWNDSNTLETVLPETGTYYVKLTDCYTSGDCGNWGAPLNASSPYSLELHRIASYDPSSHKFNFETGGMVTDQTNDSAKSGSTVSITEFPTDMQIPPAGASSIFYGNFDGTTDVDVFKFKVPLDAAMDFNDGYVADFRPVAAGTSGNGSTSPIGALTILDASGGTILASVDVSKAEAPQLRVLLKPDTEYYLKVEQQPGGPTGSNNFYFIHFYPEVVGRNEKSPMTSTTVATPQDLDAFDSLYFHDPTEVWGDLGAGTTDYYQFNFPPDAHFEVVCSAERIGSGLRGLKMSAFKSSAGNAPIDAPSTAEPTMLDVHIRGTDPTGDFSVIFSVSATSIDPMNPSTYYRCYAY
jgi:hypothetical protein